MSHVGWQGVSIKIMKVTYSGEERCKTVSLLLLQLSIPPVVPVENRRNLGAGGGALGGEEVDGAAGDDSLGG